MAEYNPYLPHQRKSQAEVTSKTFNVGHVTLPEERAGHASDAMSVASVYSGVAFAASRGAYVGDVYRDSRVGARDGAEELQTESQRHYKSSTKLRDFAKELGSMESRHEWLESRNAWLQRKMMQLRKSFLSNAIGNTSRDRKLKTFRAWRSVGTELRLEKSLDQQTASLEQCQQVAEELGEAVKRVRDARNVEEGSHQNTHDELVRVLDSNDAWRQKLDAQLYRMELLEKILKQAEAFMTRGGSHAGLVIEECKSYDRKKLDLELQMTRMPKVEKREYTFEDSSKLRMEANEVMQKAQAMLPAATKAPKRPASPERERPPPPAPKSLFQQPQPPQPQQRGRAKDARHYDYNASSQERVQSSSSSPPPYGGGGSVMNTMPEVTAPAPQQQERLRSWHDGEASSLQAMEVPSRGTVTPTQQQVPMGIPPGGQPGYEGIPPTTAGPVPQAPQRPLSPQPPRIAVSMPPWRNSFGQVASATMQPPINVSSGQTQAQAFSPTFSMAPAAAVQFMQAPSLPVSPMSQTRGDMGPEFAGGDRKASIGAGLSTQAVPTGAVMEPWWAVRKAGPAGQAPGAIAPTL
mmetsp:Transcript_9203/g.24146  ORF Transcript_9203/g.24146 Transcript_9203/m.24146 type:complete len:577 (-) Transcript_9203:154-1884(-)|eukprot:CAMPEP_0117519434 /NCGR_PEP_ID=MMETSP0784-20121206/32648_1 /TAXON_ID=39447 /ORGANISM="" /LENGTH=576 /DNA_ID=CAMNT_0005315391 /DNA_START=50 /DNA_END=1780 /DNA_ORIENTATION=+